MAESESLSRCCAETNFSADRRSQMSSESVGCFVRKAMGDEQDDDDDDGDVSTMTRGAVRGLGSVLRVPSHCLTKTLRMGAEILFEWFMAESVRDSNCRMM